MYLIVSGGKGRLTVPATAVKPVREAFIEHVYRAAELVGLEAPPREAFKRDTSNPTFEVYRGIERGAEQGRVAVALDWLDPILGFHRFVVDVGPRPDGYGCERLDDMQPWGPENARWVLRNRYSRISIPPEVSRAWRCKREELAARYGPDVRDLERRAGYWLYQTWTGMLERCNDRSAKSYKNYGGRGIMLCEDWDDSYTFGFEKFASYVLTSPDLGPRPEGCTLDRLDVNQDYEPGNLRWGTGAEQARNKRPKGDPGTPGRRARREAALTEAILRAMDENRA